MPTKTRGSDRVKITGVGWKKPMSISAEKFAQVSPAVLAALTSEPIKFSELTARVAKLLPQFEGSIAWYTITVARELEVQGRLVRHAKPVLYSRPARSEPSVRSGTKRVTAVPVDKTPTRAT